MKALPDSFEKLDFRIGWWFDQAFGRALLAGATIESGQEANDGDDGNTEFHGVYDQSIAAQVIKGVRIVHSHGQGRSI